MKRIPFWKSTILFTIRKRRNKKIATTSLWRIKGRLNQVLDYIENDEKTKTEDLESVLKYATQKEKTGVSVDDEGTPVIKQLVGL